MTDKTKEETVIATETYTVATASLQKQVAEELDVPDPEPETAKAAIDENVIDGDAELEKAWARLRAAEPTRE